MNCFICEQPVKRKGNKTCSKACDAKRRSIVFKGITLNTGRTHFPKGQRAFNYKGYWTTTKGYVVGYHPEHPTSNEKGYIKEHRYVAEMKLGRSLEPNEVVHHINHNRGDNRPENLEVMIREEHNHLHLQLRGYR